MLQGVATDAVKEQRLRPAGLVLAHGAVPDRGEGLVVELVGGLELVQQPGCAVGGGEEHGGGPRMVRVGPGRHRTRWSSAGTNGDRPSARVAIPLNLACKQGR